MFMSCCFVLLASLWCWRRWNYRRIYSFAAKLPTISLAPLPFIGQLYIGLLGLKWWKTFLIDIFLWKDYNGKNKIITLWLPNPIVFVRGREDVQKILTVSSTAEKSDRMHLIEIFAKDTILTSSGETWKLKRRFYNNLFHSENMDALMSTFNRNCKELVNNMSKHVGQGDMNVFPHLIETAIISINHVIFGYDVQLDPELIPDLKYAVKRVPELWFKRNYSPWIRREFLFQFFYRKEIELIKSIGTKFFETLLKKVISQSNQKNDVSQTGIDLDRADDETGRGSINFLTVFDELQKHHPHILNDTSLRDDVFTLFTTGTDTIGVTLSAGLMLLGQYQSVQERLFKEIHSVVGLSGDVTPQDLLKLPYLDQVYKETLRWANPIPVAVRKTTKDIKLSCGVVPAGVDIFTCLSSLNQDPETFPNPEIFDPDRFSPENRIGSNKSDFLPFSGGPRNCIGKKYSDVLSKIILIHVLRKFKITTTKDVASLKWEFAVTLISAEGYPIQLGWRDLQR